MKFLHMQILLRGRIIVCKFWLDLWRPSLIGSWVCTRHHVERTRLSSSTTRVSLILDSLLARSCHSTTALPTGAFFTENVSSKFVITRAVIIWVCLAHCRYLNNRWNVYCRNYILIHNSVSLTEDHRVFNFLLLIIVFWLVIGNALELLPKISKEQISKQVRLWESKI